MNGKRENAAIKYIAMYHLRIKYVFMSESSKFLSLYMFHKQVTEK